MSSAWLNFPVLSTSDLTVRVDAVNMPFSILPMNTFDGANLGNPANSLVLAQVDATVDNLQPKMRIVELRVTIERVENNGSLTTVVSFITNIPSLWDAEGDDRTGGFQYLSSANLLSSLGAPTGATYRLTIATPLHWVDPVQDILRYLTESTATATFVY